MDIETASELTGESRTKLAQAKLRGLVRTLISEALTAQKNWEEIKDSLHLKISNVDIPGDVGMHITSVARLRLDITYGTTDWNKQYRCMHNNS